MRAYLYKKRGKRLLPVPPFEAFALPIIVETSNIEAHECAYIYIYQILCLAATKGCQTQSRYIEYTIFMSIYRYFVFDYESEFAKFQRVKNKA